MKLEYLDDISDGGRYKGVVSENLIRLYDFDKNQTNSLVDLINQSILINDHDLDLSSVEFIERMNCELILRISKVDKGILKTEKPNFFICDLTKQSYKNAVELMNAVADGYNWLCDTSKDDIDFLYSSGGTW